MVIIPLLFKLFFSQSKLYFFRVRLLLYIFVYHAFISAITIDGTIYLNFTVTFKSPLCFFLKNLFVMPFDYLWHVLSTTIVCFNGIFVKDFVWFAWAGEVFFYQKKYTIEAFLVKKSYMKIQKYFRIILIVYAQFLTKNVLILQSVPIPLNCILPIHSSTKCFNTFILYTTDALFDKMFEYLHIVYYRHTLSQLFIKHYVYFFFLIFWHPKIPPSIGMPRYWH